MKRKLDGLIDALSLSNDDRSTRLALITFARQCGFEHFAYVNVRSGDPEAFTNYPKDWTELYFANQYQKVDPVITSAKRELKPFFWPSPAVAWALAPEERQFYSHARQFGIVSGLSIPIRVDCGRIALLTFASHLPDFKGEGKIDDIQAITATTLVHASLKMHGPAAMTKPCVQLTTRQKQCLNWMALGKSMPETADILGIKESTVRSYMNEARTRLGAYNSTNAVYLAARLGLI